MKKYEITWTTKILTALKDKDPLKESGNKKELISYVNSIYGYEGWELISVTQNNDEITLFFQRSV